ncbi:hypothetical protein AVEN_245014-1 [Araneus ventricosus]|uniref:Uncharacterized protein n=1 Tax=Araneus ventricosus TaxID=182803 RepID=A0A4Y2WC66_ARAVE|nr:hypothetical protein AVEN_245014-1 [Araneus ventricosus]
MGGWNKQKRIRAPLIQKVPDRECKAIRVSVIISPIKRTRNIVKDRRIETEQTSCSSEAKRNKDFESSSVKIIQNDSKINIYPNSEDNERRDYSSTEHSASFSSSIIKFSDEHISTLHSSDDENASGDYTRLPDLLSLLLACFQMSSSCLDEQEETLDSFVDEIARRYCIAIEPSTSLYASGSHD